MLVKSIFTTVFLLTISISSLRADTIVVSNTNDAGPGSLREALALVDHGDEIVFEAGVSGTIVLTSGSLRVDKSVTLVGPGASSLAVSGDGQFVVLEIEPAVDVVIRGLKITDGVSTSSGSGINISSSEIARKVILESLHVTGNQGIGIDSGYSFTDTLRVENSTISNNSMGIQSFLSLVVVNSTISGNLNGGVWAYDLYSAEQPFPDIGCVITQEASTTVLFSTIVGNDTDLYINGDIPLCDQSDFIINPGRIDGSIIGHTAVYGIFTGGMNLSFSTEAFSYTVGGIEVDNLRLNPLANNGGETPTHSLKVGSPARDLIPQGSCDLLVDQRGLMRPVDGTGDGSALCDAGALEAQSPLPVELSRFRAQVIDNRINLSWRTLSETNNMGFFVELNNLDDLWKDVAFVEGGATSSIEQSYSAEIKNMSAGVHRIRLRQIDFDGSESLSEVLTIHIDIPDEHLLQDVYPNPFGTSLTVILSPAIREQMSISLFDQLGRMVHEEELGILPAGLRQKILISDLDLVPGSYYLRVEGEGQHSMRVLIKQ